MQALLLVHKISVPYIKNTLEFIKMRLSSEFSAFEYHEISNHIGEVQAPEKAVVFIIGENLPAFQKAPGVTYVYFNFSVVSVLGNPFHMDFSGYRLIRRKMGLLRRKLQNIDVLIDYYPPQTEILQKKIAKPVLGFLPCGAAPQREIKPLADRPYDVCFVGSMSARRLAVKSALEAAGLRLSPTNGADLEVFSAQSRCLLNVHLQKSNHLEIPRIFGSLSTGTPVVTEHSYRLEDVFSDTCFVTGRIDQLVEKTQELLADESALQTMSHQSANCYAAYYAKSCGAFAHCVDAIKTKVTLRGSS